MRPLQCASFIHAAALLVFYASANSAANSTSSAASTASTVATTTTSATTMPMSNPTYATATTSLAPSTSTTMMTTSGYHTTSSSSVTAMNANSTSTTPIPSTSASTVTTPTTATTIATTLAPVKLSKLIVTIGHSTVDAVNLTWSPPSNIQNSATQSVIFVIVCDQNQPTINSSTRDCSFQCGYVGSSGGQSFNVSVVAKVNSSDDLGRKYIASDPTILTVRTAVSPVKEAAVNAALTNESCIHVKWNRSSTDSVSYSLICNGSSGSLVAGNFTNPFGSCCGLKPGEIVQASIKVLKDSFEPSSPYTQLIAATKPSRIPAHCVVPSYNTIESGLVTNITCLENNFSEPDGYSIKLVAKSNKHVLKNNSSMARWHSFNGPLKYSDELNITVWTYVNKSGVYAESFSISKLFYTEPDKPRYQRLKKTKNEIRLKLTESSKSDKLCAKLSGGEYCLPNRDTKENVFVCNNLPSSGKYNIIYWAEFKGKNSTIGEEREEAMKAESEVSLAVKVVTGVLIFLAVASMATVASIFYFRRFQDSGLRPTDQEFGLITLPALKEHPVAIKDFSHYAAKMLRDSELEVHRQFEELREASAELEHELFTCEAAMEDANRAKNRYTDILPYDHTRVTLESSYEGPGSPPDDYINANYIKGLDREREFIASQGPLPGTVEDHWRMIYEHKITLIVTLTQCTEGLKRKSEPYWPDEVGQSVNYEDIKVVLESVSEMGTYTVRKMLVTCSADRNHIEPLEVVQLYYLGWADFGVPNVDDLADFLANMRSYAPKAKRDSFEPPILVHCSAGVGRTGTLIALDILVRSLEQRRVTSIDVYRTVMELRTCRKLMVQTKGQLAFIYRFMVNFLEKRGYISAVSASDRASILAGAANGAFQLSESLPTDAKSETDEEL